MKRIWPVVAIVVVPVGVGAALIGTLLWSAGDDPAPPARERPSGDLGRLAGWDEVPRVPAPGAAAAGGEAGCGDFWRRGRRARLALTAPLADPLSERLDEVVDGDGALSLVDGACQTQPDRERISTALTDLGERARVNPDRAAAICRIWTGDLEEIRSTGAEAARLVQEAFALGDEDRRPELYATLAAGGEAAAAAAAATVRLPLTTHAGRVAAASVARAQEEVAAADRRVVGRSTTAADWIDRPGLEADLDRWKRVVAAAADRLRAASAEPDLQPELVAPDCRRVERAAESS